MNFQLSSVLSDPLFRQIEQSWLRVRPQSGDQPIQILVGVSGGADSMALLVLLAALTNSGRGHGAALQACHVNYGLRGIASSEDEAFVRHWCAQLGVPLKAFVVTPEDIQGRKGQSLQEWARDKRRDYFQLLLEGCGGLVALAHHRDDLVENILFRMLRGFAMRHWDGMDEEGSGIWRPFLEVTKRDILDFLGRQNLPHRHDESNDKMIYSRNQIRLQVLPVMEQAVPGAREKVHQIARDVSELVDYCEGVIAKDPSAWRADGFALAVSWLRDVPLIVAGTALDRLFHRTHRAAAAARRRWYEMIWQQCRDCKEPASLRWETMITDHVRVCIQGGWVFFSPVRRTETDPLQYQCVWSDINLVIGAPPRGVMDWQQPGGQTVRVQNHENAAVCLFFDRKSGLGGMPDGTSKG